MITPPAPVAEQVRGAAFRRLLRTGAPASPAHLAEDLDRPESEIRATIGTLCRHGRLRMDTGGSVVGSAGLSVCPGRHQIDLDGRRFWTWCAYDFFGIFAALGTTGQASSPSPTGGPPLEISFRDGWPAPSTLVLFLPDNDYATCCTNMYDQWCPNSNLFRTAEDATAWGNAHDLAGSVLTLAEAAKLGATRWRRLAAAPPQ